jgi:hypothetical protein
MTTKQKKPHIPKEAPATVYKELASHIKNVTMGIEYHEGEAETIHRSLVYWIKYEIYRPEDTPMELAKEYVTINDWTVFDENGDKVSVTMDPAEIENYFDRKLDYTDKD